jgi:hypothetical protein
MYNVRKNHFARQGERNHRIRTTRFDHPQLLFFTRQERHIAFPADSNWTSPSIQAMMT